MSFSEISCQKVKARKQYECEWCPDKINPGELHWSRAYKFYGDFQTGRMHLECFEAMERSAHDLVSAGWLPGNNERGVPIR